ncbi:MAG: hypothetical protein K9G58_08110 [Bacteroidales bacterium]|nr:hypothetical protein [Bacteroidales bacterium]MCF8388033.1 hypothetical protein [Bacteroidales bacterium]MCF8398114.1 hypothetical protein [Bacteroidales bacterium]
MQEKKRKFAILINSSSFFILAYLFLYVSGQLVTIISGSLFEFDFSWFYYKAQFYISRSDWSHDSVKLIYGAVPVYYLILGIVSLIIYNKSKVYEGILKQFFLWLYLISFTLFLSSLLVGGFVNKGFGHVLRWSYLMDTGRMLHVFLALTGLVFLGYLSGRQILIAANSYFESIKDEEKYVFYLYQILYPFIIGFIIIALIRIPHTGDNSFYDLIILGGFLLAALFIRLKFRFVNDLYFEEEDKKERFSRKLLFLAIIALLVYRIVLDPGISPV